MIIVRLQGGLGNQMFQYAFGRHLALKHSSRLKLDLSFFSAKTPKDPRLTERSYNLDIFNIAEEFATKQDISRLVDRTGFGILDEFLNRVVGRRSSYVIEPHYHFSESMYELPDEVYLNGYWQTQKYFSDIQEQLRRDFTVTEELRGPAKQLYDRIRNSKSVCFNARRGDLVGNEFHGCLGADYFAKAAEIVSSRIGKHEAFVFSDDIEWCRDNFNFDVPTEFVGHEYLGHKYQDYLRLISACKHFVIPNSSFSWWAAWLNTDRDKLVIAPKAWVTDPTWNTNDLIPESWIRI